MVASGNDTVPTHSHLFHTHMETKREKKRSEGERKKENNVCCTRTHYGKKLVSYSILTHLRDTHAHSGHTSQISSTATVTKPTRSEEWVMKWCEERNYGALEKPFFFVH